MVTVIPSAYWLSGTVEGIFGETRRQGPSMRLLKPLQFKYLIYSKSLLSNNAQLWLLLFHLLTG
jgi:hypothetical protein